MCNSVLCRKVQGVCDPIFGRLEEYTGKGVMMSLRKFNYEDDELMVPSFANKK
jgi:hypothetical protein